MLNKFAGLHGSNPFVSGFGPAEVLAVAAIVARRHLLAEQDRLRIYPGATRKRAGVLRWIGVESDLRVHFGDKGDGVRAVYERYPTARSEHLVLRRGGLSLVLVHDLDPDASVPKSAYGADLAQWNRPVLFEPIDEAVGMDPPPIRHGVLFHSKTRDGRPPASMELRFPDADGADMAPRVGLLTAIEELTTERGILAAYEAAVARQGLAPQEDVVDASRPSIRTRRAE